MRATPTSIPEVIRIDLGVHTDARGQFIRLFDSPVYGQAGIPVEFAQDNVSVSGPGVLRGLHYQHRSPQGKLLSVLQGSIYDVAVDLRESSPTFGQWVGMVLSAAAPAQVWVPPGFAHGFCVIQAPAVVHYRCTTPYDPDDQRGVRWDDPDLAIEWPERSPIVSERDAVLPLISDIDASLLFRV